MSAAEVRIGGVGKSAPDVSKTDDVEMEGGNNNMEIEDPLEALDAEGEDDADGDAVAGAAEEEEAQAPKLTYIDYLRSPTVEVVVGQGDNATLLTAHEALLRQSPFFATSISAFSDDATTRRIEFPDENLEAMGAFLQYLYTGDYYPRRLNDRLENDPAGTGKIAPSGPDATDGEQLLRHARVYTLAEKLGSQELKALAHSKVHLVSTSAKGEIEYARYVYGHTPRTDIAIRKPIAMFWGQRSHVLRHEAEEDFRALCIEYPEFGFDVLSHVLDARERRSQHGSKGADDGGRVAEEPHAPKSGRKRQRYT